MPEYEQNPKSRREFRRSQQKKRRRQRIIAYTVIITTLIIAVTAALSYAKDEQIITDISAGQNQELDNLQATNIITHEVNKAALDKDWADRAKTGTASVKGRLAGKIICIDPGHASNTNSGTEPIGPGASQTKVTEPGGTAGISTGVPEYKVTLDIAQKLKGLLQADGAKVVMIREGDTFNGMGRDRPLMANSVGANLFVRIHCDGSENPSAHGASMLYPASIPGWTDDIAAESGKAAYIVQQTIVAELGVPNLGTVEHSDMMGFNWSNVPVFLAEVGFMTNPEEDIRLNSPAYQQRIAQALDDGISTYFSTTT